jgi:hypothetical protein
VLLGELAQERTKLLVDLVDDDSQTLGGAALTDDGARAALGNPELCLKLNDCLTTTVRGQKFPDAMCFNMSISSTWLATMRFS